MHNPHPSTEKLLITLLAIVVLLKLTLAGQGMFAFPDEGRYDSSIAALMKLREFDLRGFLENIFSTQGRPGDVFGRLLSAFLQVVCASVFQFNFYGLHNTIPVFMVNYLTHLCVLAVHYKFSKLVFESPALALFSTLVLASLVNSFIYLRHCLPYDSSLLLLFISFYVFLKNFLKNTVAAKNLVFAGTLAITGYLFYPGYSLFFIALTGSVFFLLAHTQHVQGIRLFAWFVTPAIFILSSVELLSRAVSQSFFLASAKLSKTILQGSCEESLIFFPKYLLQVERVTGIALLLGCVASVIAFFTHFRKQSTSERRAAFVIAGTFLLVFSGYALSGFLFHKTVLYGRLLHQFMPLLCVAAVYPLQAVSGNHIFLKWVVPSAGAMIAVVFLVAMIEYQSIAYPRDLHYLFREGGETRQYAEISEYTLGDAIAIQFPKPLGKTEFPNFDPMQKKYLFVNCFWYFPFPDTVQAVHYDLSGWKLLVQKPHFLKFKAYQFEGYSPQERKNFDACRVQMRVYE